MMQLLGGLVELFTEVRSNDPTVAAVVSFVGLLLLLLLLLVTSTALIATPIHPTALPVVVISTHKQPAVYSIQFIEGSADLQH